MKNLVTGASGGLGRYLFLRLSADIYKRSIGHNFLRNKDYENIIHCAFGRPFNGQSESEYIEYQISIAKDLLKLEYKKLIFISTIDVISQELTSYAKAKIEVEKLILKKGKDFLIIRPGLLFGKGMRMNSLLKVAIEQNAEINLTSSSTFYPIFYSDIEELINQNLKGIYYIAAEKFLSLKEISKEYGTNPKWGNYTYLSPFIDVNCNRFISKEMSLKNPLERIKEFIEKNGWKSD